MQLNEQEIQITENKTLAEKIYKIHMTKLEEDKCCEHKWIETVSTPTQISGLFGNVMMEIVNRKCEYCGIEDQFKRITVCEYNGASALLDYNCNHEFFEIDEGTLLKSDTDSIDSLCKDFTLRSKLQELVGNSDYKDGFVNDEDYRIYSTPLLCIHCNATFERKVLLPTKKVNSNPYNLSALEQRILDTLNFHTFDTKESALEYLTRLINNLQRCCNHVDESKWEYIKTISTNSSAVVTFKIYDNFKSYESRSPELFHSKYYVYDEGDSKLLEEILIGNGFKSNGRERRRGYFRNNLDLIRCPLCGKVKCLASTDKLVGATLDLPHHNNIPAHAISSPEDFFEYEKENAKVAKRILR